MAINILRYTGNHQLSETLTSIGRSEEYTIQPDDRIELVQTINGVTIADGGRYTAGDRYTVTVVVDNATYNKIKTIWATRETVDVRFDDNSTVTNVIVLVRSIAYYDKLMPEYKKLSLEIWKDT